MSENQVGNRRRESDRDRRELLRFLTFGAAALAPLCVAAGAGEAAGSVESREQGGAGGGPVTYLRMTIARWSVDLEGAEGAEAFRRIQEEGIAVFHRQPGFIQYRLMKADARTTVAVAQWESEELGKPGAMNYRKWLKESGIMDKLVLETLDGPIVATS